MSKTSAVCVSLEDLSLEDEVLIHDYGHNAHGARGKVYHLDPDTKLVSVVTKGLVDTWEGCADGLQKIIA
ncbi:hypothetical protein IFT69_18205 [Pseudomonas putida]|nr:hypothetical protein [Pseudomonas putida]